MSTTALLLLAAPGIAPAQTASPPDVTALIERLNRLEAANAQLTKDVERLSQAQATQPTPEATEPTPAASAASSAPVGVSEETITPIRNAGGADSADRALVGVDPAYGYAILDHAENVNNRQLLQLQARRDGKLDRVVTLSGAVTAIADAHWSNTTDKFAYLMRHPTANNHRTRATQEIVINSAQLAVTATPTSSITAYAEMLYDPEQSFGPGTITALSRNQVQLRKAWVMWGNLSRSPFYAAIGKMDVPFGLEDTVSPFTNSTNWHAFAPLAYGGLAGYYADGLSLRAMAIVGGSQFRGANTPVDGANVPSKVNNFALDGSYSVAIADQVAARLGGSYIHGSAYCQQYPVFHFDPCLDNNPAWSVYGQLDAGRMHVIADFAQTTKVLPGSAVPASVNPELALFPASRVSSLTLGARYLLPISDKETKLSFEFSRFKAGAKNAPWERQTQWVLGLSHRLGVSVDTFVELVRTNGYVPLNFMSGGNLPDGSSWSVRDARSTIIVAGVQAAF